MEKLRIAIQKSGRLSEKSLALITEAGVSFNTNDRLLVSSAQNFPVEMLFLRDDDIPQYVYDGVADIGIVGENVVLEKCNKLKIIKRLSFGKCRMSLAVPKAIDYKNAGWLRNKKIATSYPVILQRFLDAEKIKAEIHVISGSVEIAPGIGLADCIFDIVSTGSTLISNGLKEVETVIKSEAVIVARNEKVNGKKDILNKLLFRIEAVQRSKNNKYILLNAPNNKIDAICKILPGMKSPTVMPLAEKGWSSLHSVITENDFWEVIDKLKANGAQGILVVPIEKMIV
jgi:ATP phosphoribosyltransferase